jgi:hypothetical protein
MSAEQPCQRYSGVVGHAGKWLVKFRRNGRDLCIGHYEDPELAAWVADFARYMCFGLHPAKWHHRVGRPNCKRPSWACPADGSRSHDGKREYEPGLPSPCCLSCPGLHAGLGTPPALPACLWHHQRVGNLHEHQAHQAAEKGRPPKRLFDCVWCSDRGYKSQNHKQREDDGCKNSKDHKPPPFVASLCRPCVPCQSASAGRQNFRNIAPA